MNRHSSLRDMTAVVRTAQPSQPHLIAYLCDHKGLRLGGEWRGKLPMRCPMCVHSKGRK